MPCKMQSNHAQIQQIPRKMTDSSSKLLQAQGKWYQERKKAKQKSKTWAKRNPKTILNPYAFKECWVLHMTEKGPARPGLVCSRYHSYQLQFHPRIRGFSAVVTWWSALDSGWVTLYCYLILLVMFTEELSCRRRFLKPPLWRSTLMVLASTGIFPEQ